MILLERVVKRFGEKTVLSDLSLSFEAGRIHFVLGRSGTGKSVLLKILVGLLRADSGRVVVDGASVGDLDAEGLRVLRRKCGIVFQQPALLDYLTVEENIALALQSTHLSSLERDQVIDERLHSVGLNETIRKRLPSDLSYGFQKRVSIARTLAAAPSYLLFDEPTTGLDPIASRAINQLIYDLSRRLHVTSLVVSHDMHCALEIADQCFVLEKGEVVAQGTSKEMLTSDVEIVSEFMREVNSNPYVSALS